MLKDSGGGKRVREGVAEKKGIEALWVELKMNGEELLVRGGVADVVG